MSRGLIPDVSCAMSLKKEITCCSKTFHDVIILPKGPRADTMGPGASGNLSEVAETMIGLRAALEDLLEHKKKEKEDSKNFWN